MSRLAVIVDGRRLSEDEARAIWTRFSAHMDLHQGDFEGFAMAEGYASASVAVAGSTPTLSLVSGASAPKEAPAGGATQGRPAKNKPLKKPGEKQSKKARNEPGKKQGRKQAERDDGRGGTAPPRRKR